MSSRALRLSLVGLALLFAVTELAAQRTCDLISSNQVVTQELNGGRVFYVSLPRFECDDGTRMRADSSVTFETTSFSQLFGGVVFEDVGRELRADRAQYYSDLGRLLAQGSVRLLSTDDGSLVTGEDLVLLQEGDDRPEDDVTVRGGRPHASLVQRPTSDSTATAPDAPRQGSAEEPVPYEVDADLIHMVGDRLFQARGRVTVDRESLNAYGDSLEFQQDIGWLTLFENARILSQDTVSGDTLDVRGDTITMRMPDDQLDELESRGHAHLLGNDVDMRAPLIRLTFDQEELERVFAVRRMVADGPAPEIEVDDQFPSANLAQPRALAEDFELTGDSIQADLLEEQLERIVAVGVARGVSTARDSLNTDETDQLIRNDWIEGDTIIATFRSVPVDSVGSDPGDSGADLGPDDPNLDAGPESVESTERQLELLIARGRARTFYRTAPESAAGSANTSTEPPCLELHYVVGDEVRLFMKNGEVERMEVVKPTGAFLEPACGPGNGGVR